MQHDQDDYIFPETHLRRVRRLVRQAGQDRAKPRSKRPWRQAQRTKARLVATTLLGASLVNSFVLVAIHLAH
jgi:hypothetical protein